jgi:hypothetical protein
MFDCGQKRQSLVHFRDDPGNIMAALPSANPHERVLNKKQKMK